MSIAYSEGLCTKKMVCVMKCIILIENDVWQIIKFFALYIWMRLSQNSVLWNSNLHSLIVIFYLDKYSKNCWKIRFKSIPITSNVKMATYHCIFQISQNCQTLIWYLFETPSTKFSPAIMFKKYLKKMQSCKYRLSFCNSPTW